jgi:hypothetical protein
MRHQIFLAVSHAQGERNPRGRRRLNLLSSHTNILAYRCHVGKRIAIPGR